MRFATRALRRLTIARPVRITSIQHIGKELNALRVAVRGVGISRAACESGVSKRAIQMFANNETTPQRATLSRLKATVESLRLLKTTC